jgi:hypothetical protein
MTEMAETYYALLSNQGTAMSETGLCGQHYANPETREMALEEAARADDWDGNPEFTDVSGNDAIHCIVEEPSLIQRLMDEYL